MAGYGYGAVKKAAAKSSLNCVGFRVALTQAPLTCQRQPDSSSKKDKTKGQDWVTKVFLSLLPGVVYETGWHEIIYFAVY